MDEDDKLVTENTNMYLGRCLTCNLALWSTLAGIDGVFVSAASIVASLNYNAPWLLFGILLCCGISLVLLLWNFYSWRNEYRVLASQPPTDVDGLKSYTAWLLSFRQQVPQHRRNCNRRENICIFLLAITIALFAVWISSQARMTDVSKPAEKHYELRIMEDGTPLVFDPSTGQIYGYVAKTNVNRWVALPKLPK